MAPRHWEKYHVFPPSLTYSSYLNPTKCPLDHYLDCDTSYESLSQKARVAFSVCPTTFWSMSLLIRSVGFLMLGSPLCFQNVALAMWKNKQWTTGYEHNGVLGSRLGFKINYNRNLDMQTYSSACSWPTKKQRRPATNGAECWESLWRWSGQ